MSSTLNELHLGLLQTTFFYKKWADPGLFFCLFSSFQPVTTLIHYYIDKSIDIVLGIRTRRVQDGRRKQNHISLQTTSEALMYLYFASTAAQMDP